MCATSATNVAQNVAQFYLYFKYKCPPATRSRLLGWDELIKILKEYQTGGKNMAELTKETIERLMKNFL